MMNNSQKTIIHAYDRIQEAHWNIHQMEQHFHESDAFRYSLNSFSKSTQRSSSDTTNGITK